MPTTATQAGRHLNVIAEHVSPAAFSCWSPGRAGGQPGAGRPPAVDLCVHGPDDLGPVCQVDLACEGRARTPDVRQMLGLEDHPPLRRWHRPDRDIRHDVRRDDEMVGVAQDGVEKGLVGDVTAAEPIGDGRVGVNDGLGGRTVERDPLGTLVKGPVSHDASCPGPAEEPRPATMGVLHGENRADIEAELPKRTDRTVGAGQPGLAHAHPPMDAPGEVQVGGFVGAAEAQAYRATGRLLRTRRCPKMPSPSSHSTRSRTGQCSPESTTNQSACSSSRANRTRRNVASTIDQSPQRTRPRSTKWTRLGGRPPTELAGSEIMVHDDLRLRAELEDPGGEGLHLSGILVGQDEVGETGATFCGGRLRPLSCRAFRPMCAHWPVPTTDRARLSDASIAAITSGLRFGSTFRAKTAPDAPLVGVLSP